MYRNFISLSRNLFKICFSFCEFGVKRKKRKKKNSVNNHFNFDFNLVWRDEIFSSLREINRFINMNLSMKEMKRSVCWCVLWELRDHGWVDMCSTRHQQEQKKKPRGGEPKGAARMNASLELASAPFNSLHAQLSSSCNFAFGRHK